MINQETFLTAFIEGVQITAERFIQISQFDKTIQATINSQNKENKKLYYVSSYGCPNFSVSTLENDTTIYSPGDQVYVNLPSGDYTSENKYIIGKVAKISPLATVRQVDKILVPNGYEIINRFSYSNSKRYQTLIIEFETYIQTSIENGLGVEENIFPFIISANNRSNNEKIEKRGLWTTNNIYGNIFDNNFPSIQRIVITGLENFINLQINWDNEFSNQKKIKILGMNKQELGEGKLIIKNLKYYFGYDMKELDNHSIYNVSILLTDEGEKYFYKEENVWKLLNDLNDLNDKDLNYKWEINWYEYNPFQVDYNSYNNPIPPYWTPINQRPSSYKNVLVLLKTKNLISYSLGSKQIYSILE